MAGPFSNKAGEEYQPPVVGETAVSSRVRQLQFGSGKTRDKPIAPALVNLLEAVGNELDVYFDVTSGGQVSSRDPSLEDKPGGWTGSIRHNDGKAADTKAYVLKDGQKHYLDYNDAGDRQLWSEIIRLSVAGGATGVGAGPGYMNSETVHIGYGNSGTWGKKGRAANAPEWLEAAYASGKTTPPLNIPDVASATSIAPTPVDMSSRVASSRMGYAADGNSGSPQGDLVQLLERRAKKFDPIESGAKPADLLTMLQKRAEKPTQAQMQAMREVPSQLKLDEVSALVDRLREAEPNGSPLTIRATPEQLTAANETLRTGLAPRPSFDRDSILNPTSSTFPARPAVIASNDPAARNPLPAARTVAPGAGVTRAQQDAMRAIPASRTILPGPARGGVAERFAQSGLASRSGPAPGKEVRALPPPSTFPARQAVIAPNIVPGMVSPIPRPSTEAATARAKLGPSSIPQTEAERLWETTKFRAPYDMPGVGMPKFADITATMAPKPRQIAPLPARQSALMQFIRSLEPLPAAQRQPLRIVVSGATPRPLPRAALSKSPVVAAYQQQGMTPAQAYDAANRDSAGYSTSNTYAGTSDSGRRFNLDTSMWE